MRINNQILSFSITLMLLLKIHCSVLWLFLIIYRQETVKFGHKKEHLLGHPLYWFYFFIVIIIQEIIPWTETIDLCYRLWWNFGYNPLNIKTQEGVNLSNYISILKFFLINWACLYRIHFMSQSRQGFDKRLIKVWS